MAIPAKEEIMKNVLLAAMALTFIAGFATAEPINANWWENPTVMLTSPLSGVYADPNDPTMFIAIMEVGPQGVFQWSDGQHRGITAYAPGATDGCINLLIAGNLVGLCPTDAEVSGVQTASGAVYLRE